MNKTYRFFSILGLLLLFFTLQIPYAQAQKKKEKKKQVVISFNESSDLSHIDIDAKKLLAERRNETGQKIGEKFTEKSFYDLDSNLIDFKKLKDKTIVINFWATWCGGCKKEEPLLKELTEKYKNNKDIVFISFCTSKKKYIDEYKKTKEGFGYKIIPFYKWKDLKKEFNVEHVPVNYIVKNGIIRENTGIPIFNEAMLKEYINSLESILKS